MKNKILFMVLGLFFILSPLCKSAAWAQNEDIFRYPLTQQTMNEFNAVCTKLAESPVIKGGFSQEKLLSRFGRSLVSSGNFIIAGQYGMVWETLQPFPSTMIMGNDFILQSRPDGQMSVVNAQGNETFTQMAGVISALFTGRNHELMENFEVFYLGNSSNWSIGLLPKNRMIASFAARITMTGDFASNGSSKIRTIRIFEQSGDVITYTLSNHNYPAELNEHEKTYFRIP